MRNGDHGSALPGFSASGIERNRRRPQRVHARRVAGSTIPGVEARGEETHRVAVRLPDTGVDDAGIEATCETGDDAGHLAQDRRDAIHVAPHHHVRHARRRRHLLDVVVAGLLRAPERQRVVQETIGRLTADLEQPGHRDINERTPGSCLRGRQQITPDEADVGLISTNVAPVRWCDTRTVSRLV